MDKEKLARELIDELGFDFDKIQKPYIISLLEREINSYQYGESSEYIRVLCGYLFCLGDSSDIPLLKKAKYGLNMDVGCMIDEEWIDCLENGGAEDKRKNLRSKEELINDFVSYYGGAPKNEDENKQDEASRLDLSGRIYNERKRESITAKHYIALLLLFFMGVFVLYSFFGKWVPLSAMHLSGQLLIEVPTQKYERNLNGLLIRDFENGTETVILKDESGISDPSFDQDASKIIFSKENEICEYDISSQKCNVILKEKRPVTTPKYVPNSDYISYYSFANNYSLTLYNTKTKEKKTIENVNGYNTCSWEPTGNYAIFADARKTSIIKYSLQEDKTTELMSGFRAVYSHDGRYIAYTKNAKERNILTVIDTASGKEYVKKSGYKESIFFGPTSDKIIFMTQDFYQKKLIVWDIKTNKQAVIYKVCYGISNDFDWR
ncbi:MAG: hypothetical protein IJR45_08930 [Firmicutes bacterium]|nr:hypothetical protein [Bacillota bacterium]